MREQQGRQFRLVTEWNGEPSDGRFLSRTGVQADGFVSAIPKSRTPSWRRRLALPFEQRHLPDIPL